MDIVLENLYTNRELQSALYADVCAQYALTRTELLILLFLHAHDYSTATDIVEKLKLAKSHVSASVRDLIQRGFIASGHTPSDHRSIHLRLCDRAQEIVRAGEAVQNAYLDIVYQGFSPDERRTVAGYLLRMTQNANARLKRHKHANSTEETDK